ncbi:ABC transporter permease [Micrococcus sp.]|uniref:ABC transporter permease n=1 Tax=Micrococcus sp. TaxID=1271 RepID=UPI002A90E712|nr:ABC transporter permease subunit [Micrococcus sp.]MDY6054505.1 ABC transporter permease subunit [Micrococcus sp.]
MSATPYTRPPVSPGSARPDDAGTRPGASLPWRSALPIVVGMELRQRLRSRGWYVLLALFFALVGVTTLGALGLRGVLAGEMDGSVEADAMMRLAGHSMFDGVLLFTLTLALLVAPALAANAISGDRAGGTLAVTQVTLLTTGQLMVGKWLAAWVASSAFVAAALPWLVVCAVVGQVPVASVVVGLVLILVEFAVVTGIGVAVSAIAGRTLFAVVVTYLVVAALTVGTVVSMVLSLQYMQVTVQANRPDYDAVSSEAMPPEAVTDEWTEEQWAQFDETQRALNPSAYDTIADRCVGPLQEQSVPDGRRVAWLLAPNPYLVLADAMPWTVVDTRFGVETTPLNALSAVYRRAQADPRDTVECLDGQLRGIDSARPLDREGTWPMWPFGLAMQGSLLAGLMWWGHRRLDTPSGRLAPGTRIA